MDQQPLCLRVEPPAAAAFEYECRGDSIVVGRSSSADLVVPDRFLSRRHARLFRGPDGWYVEGLGGRNPTLLNGQALAAPARLAPGDLLRLAETRISVAPGEPLAADDPLGGASGIFRSAATLMAGSALTRTEALADPAAIERLSGRLRLLNEVHRALAGSLSLEELLELILDRAFTHLKPEEAAVYLRRDDGELFRAAERRPPGSTEARFFSRRLGGEVVGKGLAALVLDTRVDERFASSDSVMLSGVRSILAAPLLDAAGCLGMIQLHSGSRARQYSEEDLELLAALAGAAALRIRNLALAEEAAQRRLLEKELALAAEIQTGMLPRRFPERPGLELAAALKPARAVGGDLYDVVADGERLWLLIGDVAGKGVGAALFMAVTRTLFRASVRGQPSLATAVARINDELAADNDSAMFVTAFAACLELGSGELAFVNAGHPRPYRLTPDGAVAALEAPPGPPLGVLAGHAHAVGRLTLRPGDGLLLYTDGVSEAENAAGEQFQVARLEACLRGVATRPAAVVVQETLAAVESFVGGHPRSDDVTLLALRYRSAR